MDSGGAPSARTGVSVAIGQARNGKPVWVSLPAIVALHGRQGGGIRESLFAIAEESVRRGTGLVYIDASVAGDAGAVLQRFAHSLCPVDAAGIGTAVGERAAVWHRIEWSDDPATRKAAAEAVVDRLAAAITTDAQARPPIVIMLDWVASAIGVSSRHLHALIASARQANATLIFGDLLYGPIDAELARAATCVIVAGADDFLVRRINAAYSPPLDKDAVVFLADAIAGDALVRVRGEGGWVDQIVRLAYPDSLACVRRNGLARG